MSKAIESIRKKMGHLTHDFAPVGFLDTKNSHLNGVLGCDLGIPYGKILEISGNPSNGKTLIAIDLASAAQADGAEIIWCDFENSFDREWGLRRDLKCDPDSGTFHLLQPYVGIFGKEKTPRLIKGEEMLQEAESVMDLLHKKGAKKLFIVVDSVAAILTEEEESAGMTEANFRTTMSLPKVLNKLLRRWTPKLQAYAGIALFLNQIRVNPMKMFGDPTYTMGGNAMPFYAHVRARVKRVKGGRILKNGKMSGVKGIITNEKNKAGGVEGEACGYKMYFSGKSLFIDKSKLLED